MTKAERLRNMRYKKPVLAGLGYDEIVDKLCEISENCADIRWFMEEDDTLLNALDGDEEDEYEFRMSFAELDAESERLNELIRDFYGLGDYFDNCITALIGNRFEMIGYDDLEADYRSLTSYESNLAFTEAGKRVMRMTKAEMLATIGQCMGIVLAFQNVQFQYDYLKATFDILRDENNSILKIIKEIEDLYEKANGDYRFEKEFDDLVNRLPEKLWVE